MNAILATLLCSAGCFVVVAIGCLIYMQSVARDEKNRFVTSRDKPLLVAVHTYFCKHGIVPKRGQLTLRQGVTFASRLHCPLVMTIGHTIPGSVSTEAQVYMDWALEELQAYDVQFLLGRDNSVRETGGEVREAYSIARQATSGVVLVVASEPHVARCRLIWKSVVPPEDFPHIYFWPVKIPAIYWLWELLMMSVHVGAPPGSRRQRFLLNVVGRKQ
jgi:hypothetical protein